MNLAKAIADQAGVALERVMLLRHFEGKLAAIGRAWASIEEFTLTQPAGTRYDFSLPEAAPIEVVAVIALDRLEAVYRIDGVEADGSNRRITSAEFRALDGAMRYPERRVKRFAATKMRSKLIGRTVRGWTNPRVAVARVGGKLFDSVELA